ncbi:glycerate kinase [Nocardioides gansuensis]|uniref:Glycerate kinase n=1 Tax=Nocardioides gansuensis TaxID=2138300 RepID=A0A2T8F7I6_9ACTN|nr:glycerate kinase [Nocardioides gansuensis]PVG81665.1 glycerate kinase [Nocardioides gansuensis]
MPDRRHRVLIAPDSFKGTFTAVQVAEALGEGFASAGIAIDLCPLADGGEGTVAALVPSQNLVFVDTVDPLGRPIRAAYGLSGDTAYVECAAASGLTLVEPEDRDASTASTFGTGLLIADAVARGSRRIVVACGGSATTDGGLGCLAAIEAAGGLRSADVIVLTDVTLPFEEAAVWFAPQKGADPAEVAALTQRLHQTASGLPKDPRGVEGSGAAGGLAGGLWAAHDASIVSGAGYVLDALEVGTRVESSSLVVTGEGRIDEQTFHGKLVGELARRCQAAGVPCVAVVGRDELGRDRGTDLGLADIVQASSRLELVDTARRLARQLTEESP